MGSVAGLATALVYGRLLRRMARPRAMRWAAVLQLLGIAGLAWPALGWGPPAAAGVLVVLYFLLYTPAATVLATLMMDHASPESPATDYTVQASLSHFFSMGLSSVGAMLAARIGYDGVIATSVALAMIALVAAVRWTPQEAV